MSEMINGHPVTIAVDVPNRVVVAQISGCENDIELTLFDNYHLSIYYPTVTNATRNRLLMATRYRTVAHCAPDDIFDEETGKRLALARLKKKYWERYAKRMEYATAWLGDILATLQAKAEKAKSVADGIDLLAELEAATTKTVASSIDPLMEIDTSHTVKPEAPGASLDAP